VGDPHFGVRGQLPGLLKFLIFVKEPSYRPSKRSRHTIPTGNTNSARRPGHGQEWGKKVSADTWTLGWHRAGRFIHQSAVGSASSADTWAHFQSKCQRAGVRSVSPREVR
jgi:hypothetical protein